MADSKIQWLQNPDGSEGKVWNPVTGCERVSPGCDNCYAIRESNLHRHMEKFKGLTAEYSIQDKEKRLPMDKWQKRIDWTGVVRCHERLIGLPLTWRKPQRVFANSMSDLFHPDVPVEFIFKVFKTMLDADRHTYLILTKQAKRMSEVVPEVYARLNEWLSEFVPELKGKQPHPLHNVQLIVSCENQEMLDLRVPYLLRTPAAVRGVSLEPMLGPINFKGAMWHPTDIWHGLKHLNWVICGGESGPGARPMHPNWVRSVRNQCVEAGVPFFFKQWGEWGIERSHTFRSKDNAGKLMKQVCVASTQKKDRGLISFAAFPPDSNNDPGIVETMVKMGKKNSGRLLDGREWNELPGMSLDSRLRGNDSSGGKR
jgi:protein gp37